MHATSLLAQIVRVKNRPAKVILSLVVAHVSRPSGRSDWEAIGRPGGKFDGVAYLVEFKHVPCKKAMELGVMEMESPRSEEVEQLDGYAADIGHQRPELQIRRHVVYTVAGASFRFFSL